MIGLPQYIDPDAWQGFEDMRKQIKKPLTDRARKLIVYELHRLKEAGHDPNAALDQSTNHCWADVYEPKEKPIQKATSSAYEDTKRMLSQQNTQSTIPEWFKEKFRRVK